MARENGNGLIALLAVGQGRTVGPGAGGRTVYQWIGLRAASMATMAAARPSAA